MKRLTLFLLILLLAAACSKSNFNFPLKGSAILKDKKVMSYDLSVVFKNVAGIQEMEKKEDRIKHAIRIIMAQRASKHLDNPSRLRSVLHKVFKSQLRQEVVDVKVISFTVE